MGGRREVSQSKCPLGWDPVAAGNRAGDGMARFTCAGKLPAALCNSIYNKALSADLAGRALFCAS